MKTFGRARRVAGVKQGMHFSWLVLVPIVVVVILVSLLPGLEAVYASFFESPPDFSEAAGGNAGGLQVLQRDFAGTYYYRQIFQDKAFSYTAKITVLWAIVHTLFTTSISFAITTWLLRVKRVWLCTRLKVLSYALSRFFRGLVLGSLIIPWSIPLAIAVPLWRAFLYGNRGDSLFFAITGIKVDLLLNPIASFWGAMAVSVWLSIPFMVLILYTQAISIGKQVFEAAALETNDHSIIATEIVYPYVRPTLLILAALNGVKACKEFSLIHMLTDGGAPLVSGITKSSIIGSTTTLGVYLYDTFKGFNGYGGTAAFSVLMAIIVTCAMFLWIAAKAEAPVKEKWQCFFRVFIAGIALLESVKNPANINWIGILLAICFLVSKKRAGLFLFASLIALFMTSLQVLHSGFLEGFSFTGPSSFLIWGVCFKKESRGKASRVQEHENIGQYRIRTLKKSVFRIKPGFEWLGSALLSIFRTLFFTVGIRVLLIILILIAVLLLYALCWLAISNTNVCYIDSLLPKQISWKPFLEIFTRLQLMRYMGNTFLIAGITALLVPVFVFPAAEFFTSGKSRKGDVFQAGLQIVQALSGMHSLIPLFAIFTYMQLVNTYRGIALIWIAGAAPFAFIVLRDFLDHQPAELREAAILEGVSPFGYMRKILVPLSLPAILTVFVTTFLHGWNSFLVPLLFLFEDSRYTVSVKLYTLIGSIASGVPQWNLFATASLCNICVLGILIFAMRDRLGYTALREL